MAVDGKSDRDDVPVRDYAEISRDMGEEGKGAVPLPGEIADALLASTGKFGRRQLAAAAFLGLVGAAMAVLSWPASRGGEGSVGSGDGMSLPDFLRYGGLLLLALGILAVIVVLINTSRRRSVLEAATRRPEEVAWVYLEKIGLLQSGEPSLALRPHVWLWDGTHAWYQVDKRTAKELFGFFEGHCPSVCLGYDRELRKRLRREPSLLIESPVRSRKVKETRITFVDLR